MKLQTLLDHQKEKDDEVLFYKNILIYNKFQLAFTKDCIITYLGEKDENNRLKGEFHGQIGWFPSNKVKVMKPDVTVGESDRFIF